MSNNTRIAKNTLFLYFRTLLVMVVSLYTSRVILKVLGVDDYGIYNVIGGAIAMFGVISGALSNSISRYITYELGRGDILNVSRVFSTSVNIQILISLFIVIIGESLGIWFLNHYLNIPESRTGAAFWVLQCSLAIFCLNLISIPYNACIIAHEHMKAFAYVSIFEAFGKLGVCFLISLSPWDKLASYAFLLVIIAMLVRLLYGVYCHKHFEESHYKFILDKKLIRDVGAFAGWNFFTNGAYIFNTQGVNLLINMFFGVAFNAARGIAIQVEGAVMQFVNNFGMAINPQIIKNYAAGNMQEMYKLVCRGARFSYLLLLTMSFPLLFETEYVLKLWLNVVPESTALFFRLGIIGAMFTILGNTGYTACMATGNIRRYVLWVTTIGCLVFPATYVAYRMGASVYASYLAYIVVYFLLVFVRLWIMKGLLHFPVTMFLKDVFGRILIVTFLSVIFPYYVLSSMEMSFIRFILTCAVCFISTISVSCLFGVTASERKTFFETIKRKFQRKKIK